jgi:hypothetical protein
MRWALILVLFCPLSARSLFGQGLQLQGSKVVFPQGNVIGAAVSDKEIFIEQSVFHSDGPVVRVSRRLLSWSLTTNSVLKEIMLGAGESTLVADDCGRVEALEEGERILVCENYATLAVLNGDSLMPVSTIHCVGHIYDFAVDDTLKLVFVASRTDPDTQYLMTFDIISGKQVGQTRISSGTADKLQIAVDSRTKEVAVVESRLEHSGYKTDVYACGYTQTMTCAYVVTLQQTSQIAMWGQDVFLASGLLADDRHVCITSVNLDTRAVAHQYCSPRTGVHYGVGVIDGRYVIGYTGIGKSFAWKEATLTKSNSVSVWRYEDGNVAAKAVQEGADGPFQSGARIACGKSPRFVLYSELSNIAYVYSISDATMN